jgi:hypothetical protein
MDTRDSHTMVLALRRACDFARAATTLTDRIAHHLSGRTDHGTTVNELVPLARVAHDHIGVCLGLLHLLSAEVRCGHEGCGRSVVGALRC